MILFTVLECDPSCLTCNGAGPEKCKTCEEGQNVNTKNQCTGTIFMTNSISITHDEHDEQRGNTASDFPKNIEEMFPL